MSFHINLLKKPAARPLDAECLLLKLGKRLAVGEIWLHSGGERDPVAHTSAAIRSPTVDGSLMVLSNHYTKMLKFMVLGIEVGIDPEAVVG